MTTNNNTKGIKMITEMQAFRAFNIDMTAVSFPGAAPMPAAKVRGNNKYLWRFVKHNDPAKVNPASVPAKVHPKTHEIISGTPERIAALEAHAARIAAIDFNSEPETDEEIED
jgi:hypothetical protein